ncbi:hypothetical protein KQ51_00990 [Candidatus Izimaplasma bacterium HR1]|uniref:DUF819 family protein n=1 Tax=Candidatus Izimoplasma sp. HR1 TaxID=1541959 RepID=UPI0004F73F2C|nr:hypothetical protein KQ51_00990 [Candidatus Izimaplasma bacterium HR1]
MAIVWLLVQVIAIFLVPVLIIKYHNMFITRWIGTIGSAYLFGILVAIFMFVLNKLGLDASVNKDLGEIGSHLAISIAIPLLLFSANLKEVRKLSKTVLKSFGSLILSAIIVSSIVYYVYAKTITNGAELSGMAIGLYTGGTPNLNAIGNFFRGNGVGSVIISSANLSDMIIGAIFYIFLLVLCKPLLSKFLRKRDEDIYITNSSEFKNTDELDIKSFKFSKKLLNRILLAFGITVLGAGIGFLIFTLKDDTNAKMTDFLVPAMMMTVTILGIVFSFNKKIRETKGMNVVGQYGILVFSFALASSLDLSLLTGIIGDTLILYGSITIGVFILHVLFSKLMNIDVDCTMVTLTAGLYGPAFVPAITKQIKNDDLTVPGLITGSIGYAIGTFLGIALVYLYLL